MHGLPCTASGGLLLPCECLVRVWRGAMLCVAWRGRAVCAFWAGRAGVHCRGGVSVLGVGRLFTYRRTFRRQMRYVWRCAVCWRCIIPRCAHCCRVACVWALLACETWGIMPGRGTPPCRGIHVGVLPFSDFFFYFFLGGGCGSVGHGVGCVGSVRNATRTGQECNIMQSR